ncbi:MAG: hypothetical protein KAX90_00690 [Pseudomonas sp.]|nr:hypothetical protein [Pseudomonas sp.]
MKRCGPTTGKNYNPSSWARQWQGRGLYKGRDAWSNTTLRKGDIIYGGFLGQSGFYFDKTTLAAAGGSRAALWRSLQVLPHPQHGFRGKVQAYRVKSDVAVGTGQAKAQDPAVFGTGGGAQVFMSNYKTVLEPVGKPFDLGI